jgi:hypothetical protein
MVACRSVEDVRRPLAADSARTIRQLLTRSVSSHATCVIALCESGEGADGQSGRLGRLGARSADRLRCDARPPTSGQGRPRPPVTPALRTSDPPTTSRVPVLDCGARVPSWPSEGLVRRMVHQPRPSRRRECAFRKGGAKGGASHRLRGTRLAGHQQEMRLFCLLPSAVCRSGRATRASARAAAARALTAPCVQSI